jgi:hypothetical protein
MQFGKQSLFLFRLNAGLTLVLLICIAFWVHDIKSRVESLTARAERSDVLRIVTAILNNNNLSADDEAQLTGQLIAAIYEKSQPLLSNATTTFLFGDVQGVIGQFFVNVFGYQFNEFATSVESNSGAIVRAFRQAQEKCPQWRTCEIQGLLECPNGRVVNCDYMGETVNCARDCGVYSPVIDTFSVVQSVASVVRARWQDVPLPDSSALPAFSNGVFRLDLLLTWIKSQVIGDAWHGAGVNCLQFVSRLRSIPWVGQYISSGEPAVWDARNQVRSISEPVLKVCEAIAQI